MSKKSNKGKGKALAVIGVIILVGAAGFVGWLWGNDWMFSTNPKEITPELDGVINKREWARSSYNVPFYLDVDNSIDTTVGKSNVDGWNYIYVAEDSENYYVALDLCSDRTNNLDGEWISMGIGNRIPDTFSSQIAFHALENYGFEYFVYNVSEDGLVPYYFFPGFFPFDNDDIPYVPEYNSFELTRGEFEGDFKDLWSYDDEDDYYDVENVFKMTSSYDNPTLWTEGQYAAVQFGINVTEMMPTYNSSIFLAALSDFEIHLHVTANLSASTNPIDYNTYAETMWFSVLEHGPMAGDFEDASYLANMNDQGFTENMFSYRTVNFDYNQINASNGMYYFSLIGWNPENATESTAFELYLNRMKFKVTTPYFEAIRGTTIEEGNYDVSFDYGTSEYCEEDHRMFEFRVDKSEFPVDLDDHLYINVAGYGTMSMEGTNYWVYPTYTYGITASPYVNYYQTKELFLQFDMSIT